jgi:HEAT repeat protein
MLDNAFEALKKHDWGTDLGALNPIEDAVVAAHGKPDVTKDLESRLLAALSSDISLDARDYICRKLAVIGTAACVPVLAGLLKSKEASHMARFALERIPVPQSGEALRDALQQTSGAVKVGVISSLGSRRDTAAVAPLSKLLKDSDASVARSAALALGMIGTADAAKELQSALASAGSNSASIIDAILECAESMLSGGKQAEASAIYKSFAQENQPRLVRLAATRGLLACASKQA